MDDRNAVRCMRHCSGDFNVFYVEFPEYCPVCKGKLKGSFLNVPPFYVPHPFKSSSQVPYSVVVKPTDGLVYNYNESGIHVDEDTTWSLCVALTLPNILNSRRECWDNIVQSWDEKLKNHSQNLEWVSEKYNPFTHNCYNFALSFLRIIMPEQHSFQSKESFCKAYVVPLMTRAAKYIDLHRRILNDGAQIRKASVT